MMLSMDRESILKALKEEVDSWGYEDPGMVSVPAQFLVDVYRLLSEDAEEDDMK